MRFRSLQFRSLERFLQSLGWSCALGNPATRAAGLHHAGQRKSYHDCDDCIA
jgi:hypothetical protein